MSHLESDAIDRAERFIWSHGRLLERLRFAFLFRAGDAHRAARALGPYQNDDGGFGQGLEPDYRGPMSQPLVVDFALRLLDELGAFATHEAVAPALRFLESIVASDGGLPNVLTSAQECPHAPWWQADPAQPGCLLPTASLVGLLHKRRLTSAFVTGASEFCWRALAAIPARIAQRTTRIEGLQIAYEARAALVFLEHTPERARAAQVAAQLGAELLRGGLVQLDSEASSEATSPLDYAPHPSSPARAWFAEDLLVRHLAALARDQQADGGFTIGWAAWCQSAHLEWRAIQTIEQLKTLRSYGSL